MKYLIIFFLLFSGSALAQKVRTVEGHVTEVKGDTVTVDSTHTFILMKGAPIPVVGQYVTFKGLSYSSRERRRLNAKQMSKPGSNEFVKSN